MVLRPTPDAMRERVFAVLGGRTQNAVVLDLFCGTGAVGLEALSRGADRVVFVERHRAAAQLTRVNCSAFDLGDSRAKVMNCAALSAVKKLADSREKFDLVWADPPFDDWEDGLRAVCESFSIGLMSTGGLACLECPEKVDIAGSLPSGLQITRDLTGGASRVAMIESLKE